MGAPLKPEVIAELQAAKKLHEELKQAPDIIAYKHNKLSRAAKGRWVERGAKLQKLRKKKIKAVRHKVVVAMASGKGGIKKVAEHTGLTPATVKAVIQDKSFDKHLSNYQNGVLAMAKGHLMDALEEATLKLIALGRKGSGSQRIQYEAVKDIMDRCGLKPHEVTERITRDYTKEESDSMLETAREVEKITTRLGAVKSPYLLETAKRESQKAPSVDTPKSS